jgi:flagellar P-ring protein FlgI
MSFGPSDRRGVDVMNRLLFALLLLPPGGPAEAARLKEVGSFAGVRANHLVGYGLVVGLAGQGDNDSARFTVKSLAALMQRQGVNVSEREIRVKNVAAVMVTAKLPPYSRPGSRLDVQVASTGNAKSLQGGTLLMTRLKAADGKTYALAQGAVSVGGFSLGGGGSKAQKNHATAGRVPGGAIIERAAPKGLSRNGDLSFQLHRPDFTTAARIAKVIDETVGNDVATAVDPGTVRIVVPERFVNRQVELISGIENLLVNPDQVARVIVNERTGTIVMGAGVKIKTVAISHGNLVLSIKQTQAVVQPNPITGGVTATTTNTDIKVDEGSSSLSVIPEGATLGRVVRALNALGVTTRDLIAILQAMRSAGALDAELEIL